MKCSSQRNCAPRSPRPLPGRRCLNEVQFSKELRLQACLAGLLVCGASMKCSSRRNCDSTLAQALCLWAMPQ